MGDLTKNLSRHEFECDCGCGFNTIDYQVVAWIQGAADHFERVSGRAVRVEISGGNRCSDQNERTPGASRKSWHIKARGADHRFYFRDTGEQIDPERVAKYYESKHPECGIGRYSDRTHLDSRGYKARWSMVG